LGQPAAVANVVTSLFEGTEEDRLLGYQLCFDLVDTGDQAFLQGVASVISEENALKVLTGGFSSELALSFLHKHSNADRRIMEDLKKAMEERGGGGRNSILHNAAVITHSYLYAGTTNDSFLRDHLDWMKKASNW
jgi:26S proteasome regulatory subunit N2